jgi:deoxyribodipyrimidine photo-lyase
LADFEAQGLADYHTKRDLLAEEGTSRLSPHLRWGTLSPRRCYAAAERVGGEGAQVWISELAWRDFYQAILAHHPRVLTASFRPEYDNIRWENNAEWFAAWQAGRTGFPIVDAAMRQLSATGWMHNRARMLVASFLCKDLLIDWRWGERYFMQHLLDGDSAANNGGWQWAAGTGNDAAPYFRIFNPAAQAAKFDPTGGYQRRWLPELGTPAYPTPLVNHAQQRERALAMYGVVKRR